MKPEIAELLDYAETLLCNAAPMPHCTQADWDAKVGQWRDEKHRELGAVDEVDTGVLSAETLRILCDTTVRLAEINQRTCAHFCVENFAANCLAKLVACYRYGIPEQDDLSALVGAAERPLTTDH